LVQGWGEEVGPFTVLDERDPKFLERVASQLGATKEAIEYARRQAILKPMTLDEVAEILGTTIRQDYATKLILLLSGLLTFTNEDGRPPRS
jgi:hypothetical protein